VCKVSDNAVVIPHLNRSRPSIVAEMVEKRQLIRHVAQTKRQNLPENRNKKRNITCLAPVYQALFSSQLKNHVG
jgi:hypothetical protein